MTIEELKAKVSDMMRSRTDSGFYRLDIGRYRDCRLRDIPLGYLAWLYRELSKTPHLNPVRLQHLKRFLNEQ